MTQSIRGTAYHIGRTTEFTETQAMVAGALIAEDFADQDQACKVLEAFVLLAQAVHKSLAGLAIDLLPCLRGDAGPRLVVVEAAQSAEEPEDSRALGDVAA